MSLDFIKNLEKIRNKKIKIRKTKEDLLLQHKDEIEAFTSTFSQKDIIEALKMTYNIKVSPSTFTKFCKKYGIKFSKTKNKIHSPAVNTNDSTKDIASSSNTFASS